MKRLLAAVALALAAAASFGATLNPVQLLNPTGSTAGQAIVSTGPSTAPAWSNVTAASLAAQAANTVLANATASTASPTALAVPSCIGSNNALRWSPGSGFACASGVALTTGNLSQFAATTSAQLAGVLSDETGTGSAVFSASPALTGTPTAPTASFGTSTTQLATTAFATSAAAGRLVNIQVFTASGTYTPTAGATRAVVEVQAPGAGSGGVPATSAGQAAISQGGGAGSYAKVFISSGLSSQTVTIGAVGAAGTAGANAGGTGGTTSFGSLVSCPGGTGGTGGTAVSTVVNSGTAAAAAACTISGPTTIVSVPGGGSYMGTVYVAGSAGFNAAGANSMLGQGGRATGINVAGVAGTGYGSGASGTSIGASGSAAAGTAGQPAIIEVFEFQ